MDVNSPGFLALNVNIDNNSSCSFSATTERQEAMQWLTDCARD